MSLRFWTWTNKSWKRRILIGLSALILLIGIVSAGSSGGTSSSSDGTYYGVNHHAPCVHSVDNFCEQFAR